MTVMSKAACFAAAAGSLGAIVSTDPAKSDVGVNLDFGNLSIHYFQGNDHRRYYYRDPATRLYVVPD